MIWRDLSSRPILAAGILIGGLVCFVGAGYVWVENDLAHYGQATYTITGMEGTELEPSPTVPGNASVKVYDDLPRRAQRAFDNARNGEENTLWSKDDRRAVEALLPYSTDYIKYQDEYYRILILSGHRGQRYWHKALFKFLGLGSIGLLLTGFGTNELLKHDPRDG